MDDNEPPFYVERAKSGRARCKSCRNTCDKGELRFAKMVIGQFGDGKPMKQWYHIDCMMDVFMRQRPATKRVCSIDDMGSFIALSAEDKSFILKKINEMECNYAKKHNIQFTPIDENTPQTSKADKAATSNQLPSDIKFDLNHKDNKFEQFCSLCLSIANDSKYTVKTSIVQSFFSNGTDGTGFKSDLALWCRLLLPGVIKRVYNLKSKQLIKLFSKILGCNVDAMSKDLEKGNIGETIEKFFAISKIVIYADTSTLTVFDVDDFLCKLSTLTKEDEQIEHFKTIVKKCTLQDIKYLIYLINGDLRINAGAKHILNAIHPDAYTVFESSRDINTVLSKILKNDLSSKQIGSPKKAQVIAEIMLMKPVHPMLAEACKSTKMAMEKCPNGMLSEIKYDGERVQLHKSGKEFKYFSRSLKPVMDHKVARFKEFIPMAFPHGNDMILDSEVLMVDTKTGDLLPFGSLGIHKKTEFQNAEVCLVIFDCLYFNGKSLIKEPISKRREILENNITEIKNHVIVSKVKIIHDEDVLREMIIEVLKSGQEGLVLKDLQSIYEPGKRHWLKVKKDYLFDGAMADSADLVVLGAWFGTGKKGGMLSVFLMGCYDDSKDLWLTVTKVHIGFDDTTLEELQKPLKENMVQIFKDSTKLPHWVRCTKTMIPDFITINPKVQPVWEITGAEFSKSNIHTADGISIRFPRVTKMRDDKSWETATSLKELKVLYENSKTSSNLSLLEKDSPQKKAKKSKSPINNPSTSKAPCDSPGSISKKIKLSDDESDVSSKESCIKFTTQPLPEYFKNCVIKFHTNGNGEINDSDIKEYKRYFVAYGGKIDDSEDVSEANYVVHLKNQITMEDYKKISHKFTKSARHVTLNWLKESIELKKPSNVQLCSVLLTNDQ